MSRGFAVGLLRQPDWYMLASISPWPVRCFFVSVRLIPAMPANPHDCRLLCWLPYRYLLFLSPSNPPALLSCSTVKPLHHPPLAQASSHGPQITLGLSTSRACPRLLPAPEGSPLSSLFRSSVLPCHTSLCLRLLYPTLRQPQPPPPGLLHTASYLLRLPVLSPAESVGYYRSLG